MSLYAVEKFALTNFLLENTKLYDDLFIEKSILYTLDDVYKEIDHVANTVGSLQCDVNKIMLCKGITNACMCSLLCSY